MSLDARPLSGQLEADVAAFVAGLEYGTLPAEAVRTAEECYLDTVGVTVAGAIEQPGRIAREMVERTGGGGEATVLGSTVSASVPDAAFANGTAAHALDFDDVSPVNVGHPSPPIVAATLSLAEYTDATGADLVTAYVAGFEVAARIGTMLHPGHYQAGWHSTATCGTFSAAAAAAWLLDLDEAETRNAIGIAASSPAGLQRNFGSMTKPMHAGQAARAGVTAALLASDGFTADATALGGERGFLELYSGPTGIDLDAPSPLGEVWEIVEKGVNVKKYPCCYCTHSGIAATSELVEEHGIEPGDVEAIHVETSEKGPQILAHDDPDTGFQGKFSIQYTVACAVALDRVDISAFDDEVVENPVIERLVDLTSFEADPEIPYDDYTTHVAIETTDGNRYERTRSNPPGREEPLSDEELREKFLMCADRAVDAASARDAYDRLTSLRDQDGEGVAKLVGALGVPRGE